MPRPIRSPALITRQRQKIKEGIARIMREHRFANVNQLSQFLASHGTPIHERDLDHYREGSYLPSSAMLKVLWEAFHASELNPDTFGTTGEQNSPTALRQQRLLVDAVRDFMQKRGISTIAELSRTSGLSQSSCAGLIKGTGSAEWDTVVKLHKLTGDPRLDPTTFERGEVPEGFTLSEARSSSRPKKSASRAVESRPQLRTQAEPPSSAPVDDGASGERMRFILRSDNFHPLQARITPALVADTQMLLSELYQRLAIFTQLSDDRVRQQLALALGPLIDELYLVLQSFEAEIPTGIVRIMDAQRDVFDLGRYGRPSIAEKE